MTDTNTLWIITDETPDGARDGTKDIGTTLKSKTPPTSKNKRVPIPFNQLKKEMTDFLQVVEDLFTEAENRQSGMVLDEVELSVKINGEGQVSLLGIGGGKLAEEGGILLRFKRKDSGQNP
ncbi:Pepco domain-containing protein [Limnofasciculus baicalensis]|uniref:Pepco domain-containing protein n=1 Tax=Limnofasciculus baicalensis BBK-W-15 TaxID=2699891 RepID=A0AAE3KP01_9CYAN|nr:hypothetical protein [Limnofasciculus baicalensis]MCP2730381.1 hypothetical protein [Limnofasciculus baicalensis BBK-W-15]